MTKKKPVPKKAPATKKVVRQAKASPATKRPGRPSKYNADVPRMASAIAALGATDRDIAKIFGVNEDTINEWKKAHPEFSESLKAAKSEADSRVIRRLFERATGYSHEAVKIFMPANATEPVYAPYTEHYAPDTTAAIFWLKNRVPQEWRDKVDLEHKLEGGLAELLKLRRDRAKARARGR